MNLGPYELNDIYCGDSAVMLAALPDACIDLTVTSCPYDDMDDDFNPVPARGLRKYNGYKWDFKKLAQQLYRVTKPGGVVVWVVGDVTINGSESLASSLQKIYFRRIGFNLHDTMIYQTDKPPMNDNRYQACFEYMFVFSKGGLNTFNPIKTRSLHGGKQNTSRVYFKSDGSLKPMSKPGVYNETKPLGSIWYFSTGNDKAGHPAAFPEALARDHIISWSNPGDIILDPFSGSGTTAKMAKMLQRQFIGFDISQAYVDLARRRIAAANVPLPFVMDEPAVNVEQVKLFCD